MKLKCLKGIFYSHFKLLNFILQLCLGSVARFTVQDPCQFALYLRLAHFYFYWLPLVNMRCEQQVGGASVLTERADRLGISSVIDTIQDQEQKKLSERQRLEQLLASLGKA